MQVLIWVQHLWGVGHLRRARIIAAALARGGARVTLVSGGLPVPELGKDEDYELVQLPPVRTADASFSALLDEDGSAAGESLMTARRDKLLAAFASSGAEVVITELFPFGRRKFAAELGALIDVVRERETRPLMISSLRDIVEPPATTQRGREIVHLADRFYDAVLVHGERRIVRLEVSLAEADWLHVPVHYTGYVSGLQSAAAPDGDRNEIIVSAGGGRGGGPLLRAAAAAARHSRAGASLRWRLIAGPHGDPGPLQPESGADQAGQTQPAPEMVWEQSRHDLPSLMAGAALAVGRAGYNSSVEALAAGARLLLIPNEGGGQTEQRLRAEALAAHGLCTHLPEIFLTPERLARAVDMALGRGPPKPGALDLGGAAATVGIIERLWRERFSSRLSSPELAR